MKQRIKFYSLTSFSKVFMATQLKLKVMKLYCNNILLEENFAAKV